MLKKVLLGLALVGVIVAAPLMIGALDAPVESAPCSCCGDACTCTDCTCDAEGCACATGGTCACNSGCCTSCCAD